MKIKRLAWVVSLVALGAGAHFLSKLPPPEPTPPGMVDYGPEFAKWRALGLPDTLGCEPVHVYTGGFRCGTGMSDVDRVLVGFRWSRPSGKRRVVEVVDETGVQVITLTFGWPAWMTDRASAWFKVQLPRRAIESADVSEIDRELREIDSVATRTGWPGESDGAKCLIFAAQAHRAGHEGLANRLVHQLSLQVGDASAPTDPSHLFPEAVERIVSSRVYALQMDDSTNWDWPTLVKGYQGLQAELVRTGYGFYTNRVPLEAVLPRVQGYPATMAGEGVTRQAAVLAEDLAWSTPAQLDPAWFEGEHWLFRDWGPVRDDEPPLVSLLRMGPDAIPLLLAMSSDDWPLPMRLPYPPGLGGIPWYRIQEWQMDPTFPATRGKLAKFLLEHLANRMVELSDKPGVNNKKFFALADTSALAEWKNWRALPREDRIRHFRSSRFLLMSYLAWNSPLPGETLPANPKRPWFGDEAELDENSTGNPEAAPLAKP